MNIFGPKIKSRYSEFALFESALFIQGFLVDGDGSQFTFTMQDGCFVKNLENL